MTSQRLSTIRCRPGILSWLLVPGLLTLIAWGGRADDVVDNATIAQQRLHMLFNACAIYSNDNNGHWPASLADLYPNLISDPLTFYHPGDSDPPPKTIDNDVPNAPNSAQISFEYFYSAPDDPCHQGNQPLGIRDNTWANNEGRFIVRFPGGTDPPFSIPTPTRPAVARQNLRALVHGMHIYANDNAEWFPLRLSLLATNCASYPAEGFWNPGDRDPMPTSITSDEPNQPNSALISFDYPVAGVHPYDIDAKAIVLRDNSAANNDGFGIYEADVTAEVRFVPQCPGDVTGDRRVRLRDVLVVLWHFGLDEHALFRDGDANGDGNIALDDLTVVIQHLWQTCN